jgi:uncharacterized protein YqeY
MSLKEKIQTTLTEAMRARDEGTKIPLRLVMAAIKEAEIEKKQPLEDSDVLRIVQKESKARLDTIADAEKAGRPDLIAQAEAELAILKSFLPEELSDEALGKLVEEAIQEAGASSMADMGNVMKVLMPKVQGRADGGKVSQMVRQRLQG